MTDAIDVLVARYDDAVCIRAADHLVVTRWAGEDLDPPMRFWVTADELSAHVAALAVAAVGAFRNDDVVDPDDGWKLLGVHLDEAIDLRGDDHTELLLVEGRTVAAADLHDHRRYG